MQTLPLEQVLAMLRGLAPEETALPNDPVGLLIDGDGRAVRRVGVCLDCTPEAARKAVSLEVDLVAAHHPLIYHPLRRIAPAADPISDAVATLVRAGIGLYAMHTNWDRAHGGINDTLARKLSLRDFRPLGADGLKALPRIGELSTPMTSTEFAAFVSEALGCAGPSALRVNNVHKERIEVVAVCGGAGAELARDVIAAGADAYVTSDIRHHEFLDATALGLILLDAGHGATETPGMVELIPILQEQLEGVDVVWIGPE